MDNLNFIKIYFRVFIYNIIVLKYPELSKKEIKNHRRRIVRSGSKSQFGTFGGPNGTLKVPNFHDVGFGPMAFG